ncbi:hypothetical protein [Salinigranum marinum]|uniref:hypothetical protein n=1 Tax=Salinigranum marinum TaxID=1515595 RepID=UPI002989D032|nr:hypothetical protein [Salinigranum marinum]
MSGSWWYGVALFPAVAVTTLLSDFGSQTFILVSSSGGDPNVAAGIASFVLAVASFWGGIFVALVVFGCLLADIRALGDDEGWSPSVAWCLAGLAHIGAAAFSPLLIVSVPSLTYYLFRRRARLGRS